MGNGGFLGKCKFSFPCFRLEAITHKSEEGDEHEPHTGASHLNPRTVHEAGIIPIVQKRGEAQRSFFLARPSLPRRLLGLAQQSFPLPGLPPTLLGLAGRFRRSGRRKDAGVEMLWTEGS